MYQFQNADNPNYIFRLNTYLDICFFSKTNPKTATDTQKKNYKTKTKNNW